MENVVFGFVFGIGVDVGVTFASEKILFEVYAEFK